MTRSEFTKALKNLTAEQARRARELAKGIKEQGGRNAYERAISYVLEV